MKKYSIFLAMILGLVLATNVALAKEAMKIGYINFQQAISDSKAGKDAKNIIAQKYEESKEALAKKQAVLQKMKEELEKQGLLMKEDIRKEKEKDYQIKLRDFQVSYKGTQEKLKEEEMKLTQPIVEELEKITADIGSRKGFTIVLMKSLGVIYTDKTIDITKEVVEAYNKKYTANKK